MLELRRFFQEDAEILESHTPRSDSQPRHSARNPESGHNVHEVRFSRHNKASGNARFPQVDDILDRLAVNARAVGGSSN